MRKLTAVFFTILFSNISFGQKSENKIFEASKGKWEIPIRKYINLSNNNCKAFSACATYCWGQNDSLLVVTTDSAYDVKSLHKGKVILVSEIDSSSFIVIVKFGDYYLSYTSLEEVFVKKDEVINEGQKIGRIGKNLDGIYEFDIYFWKKNRELCAKNWINWHSKKQLK
jgi:hypothetical protein